MKFTVLTCRGQLKMSKTFTTSDVIGYGLAKYFNATVKEGGFEILQELSKHKNKCVIRGIPKTGVDCNNFERQKVSVDEEPLTWVLLDYDKERPFGAPDLIEDPVGAAKSVLPECLKDVGFYWQLGSSAGIKPNKYSIHIWIELESPLTGAQVEPALEKWGFDVSMARVVQAHYTAEPTFIGVDDPVKNRCGIVNGSKAKIKEFIIAHRAKEKREQEKRVFDSRYSVPYDGVQVTIGRLLTNELHGMITTQVGNVYFCDCPRHRSDSKKSLHVDLGKNMWYCHGCGRGGKTAYSLAYFSLNDDKEAAIKLLQRFK